MQKTYELTSRLPAVTAMQRVEDLFAKEGVEWRRGDLSITSVKTPIDILGIQSRLYSKKNWVGLNPFVFVSSVDVRCEPGEGDIVRINVRIDQFRTLMWVAIWVTCSGLAASAMPEPVGAILLIAVTLTIAWLALVRFLGGFLIKKEILDCLNAGSI